MTELREITSGLQFPEGPIAMPDGSVLLVEIKRGTLSRVTPDGKISVVAHTGGGPNGAAIRFAALLMSFLTAVVLAGQVGPPVVLQLGSVEPIQLASTEATRAPSRAAWLRTLER